MCDHCIRLSNHLLKNTIKSVKQFASIYIDYILFIIIITTITLNEEYEPLLAHCLKMVLILPLLVP